MATTKQNTKSTHNGTCQVCGAIQAVHPVTGLLAKHGYTVRWGFFAGTCTGSDHKPFEKGTDCIESAIRGALNGKALTIEQAAATRARTAQDNVWVRHYKPATWADRTSGYVWLDTPMADINVEEKTYGDTTFTYAVTDNPYKSETGHSRKTDVARGHASSESLTWWQTQNERRAQELDQQVLKYDEYVAWQQARLDAWVERELIVRKGTR